MKNAVALMLLAPGCVVYSYDVQQDPPPVYVDNYAPILVDGYAGVFFDTFYGDDVWTFEATVDDPDGAFDILGVWADVYDEYRGGVLVESFELYPTDDPYFWYSDWFGSTTFLDPFYSGYTVDIVVYDQYESFDFITVWADTY